MPVGLSSFADLREGLGAQVYRAEVFLSIREIALDRMTGIVIANESHEALFALQDDGLFHLRLERRSRGGERCTAHRTRRALTAESREPGRKNTSSLRPAHRRRRT